MDKPHMNTPLTITSASNERLKRVLLLRNRRERDETGLFIIEGYREIDRAVKNGIEIVELFFCKELFLGTNESSLLRSVHGFLIQIPPHLFEKISYRDRPDGLIAIARKMNHSLSEVEKVLRLKKSPLLVIAEAIEKPGNLGTIIRSSDAAGVDGVIVTNGCTDIYNPNVVRASVGTLFSLPVVEASNEETLRLCKALNIALLAATPEGSKIYTETPMTGPLGIVVGTEQLGLSSFWKDACLHKVRIPMHGIADSLNVATATTLFLFEAVRQRGAACQ
jgi:RNA methyltransferase, TrmH family